MYPLIGSLGSKIWSPWSILRAELFIKEEDKVSYEATPGKRFLAGGLLSIDGHKKGSEGRGKTNEEKLQVALDPLALPPTQGEWHMEWLP
jgi:hypothetical protein